MANCVNKSHPEILSLSKKFNVSPAFTASVVGVWQDNTNNLERFPTNEEFAKELNSELPADFFKPLEEEVNYRLQIVKNLLDIKDIRQKIRLNSKTKPNVEDNLRKLLRGKGVSDQQINLMFDYMRENDIKEINTEDLALDISSNYGYSVEVNTAKENSKLPQQPHPMDGEKAFTVNGDKYSLISDVEFDEDGATNVTKAFKNDKEISIEEYLKGKQLAADKGINTSFYSNLTVPGGTNYTENEISTPLITPNIKGHAQFSTDQGIGWFRSDDQDYDRPSGEKSITRRVLELQSDLFQKGRDKVELTVKGGENSLQDYSGNFDTATAIVKEDDIEGWIIVDGKGDLHDPTKFYNTEREAQDVVNILKTPGANNQNQFLQLLNKNSNWVTFFIKSIIQDSAKRGYKEVLFPAGETAAKIEGHETIANDIKRLDNTIFKAKSRIEKGEYATSSEEPTETKEELERTIKINEAKKQELKSQGIEKLKPIEGFYEIRVKNTLDKLYSKENVKPITDEYGNKWFSLEIKEKDKTDLIYFQLEKKEDFGISTLEENSHIKQELNRIQNNFNKRESSTLNEAINNSEENLNRINSEVSDKMKHFFDRIGVSYTNVDRITDSNNEPISAVAKADIFNKTVEVIEDKRDITTLPEEAGHFYLEMLGEDNPLYVQMMEKIDRFNIYQETVEEYGETYGYSEEKIRKEAIGKLISQSVIEQAELNERDLNKDLFTKWWKKAWNWIKDTLGVLKSSETSPFVVAAKDLLEGKIDNLMSLNQAIDYNADPTGMVYYQLSNEQIGKRDKLISDLSLNKPVRDFENGGWKTQDGIKIKTDVNTWAQAVNRKKLSAYEEKVARKAAYMGAINSAIIKELNKDYTIEQVKSDDFRKRIVNDVIQDMLIDPEFREIFNGNEQYFEITPTQYNELTNAMGDIYKNIAKNTLRIEKLSNQEVGKKPTIYTDIALYNEKEDIAGTADLLVVYPNGTIGAYQYRNVNLRTQGGVIASDAQVGRRQLDLFDTEVSKMKKILSMQYGVEDFAETRIVPMHLQLTKDNKGIANVLVGDNQGDRSYLEQIPVADELTEDAKLNKSLTKMFSLRDGLRKKYERNREDLRTLENLRLINEQIKEIQLRRNVTFVHSELGRILTQLKNRESAPESTPDFLTIEDLNDYSEYVEVYNNYYTDLEDTKKLLNEEELKKIEQIPQRLADMKTIILNKMTEYVSKSAGMDITSDVTETSFLGSWTKQLSDFDQPTFRNLSKIVAKNAESVRNDINKIIEDTTEVQNKLKEWAKENGKTLLQAFELIYNKDTGKLVYQFDKRYHTDLEAARNSKNKAWMKENMQFDEDLYNTNRDSYFRILDKKYPEDAKAELRESIKSKFEKDFDVNKHPDSMFNPKNRFMRKMDLSKYYSEEWNNLIKPENKPLKDFYDFYTKTLDTLAEDTKIDVEKGFVPEIKQNLLSRISSIGLGAFGNLNKYLTNALEIREYDISERDMDVLTGTIRSDIPVYFMDKVREPLTSKEKKEVEDILIKEGYTKDSGIYNVELDRRITSREFDKGREIKSYDLGRNLVLFAESALTYKYANEAEDMIRSMRYIMKSDRIKTQLTSATGKELRGKLLNKLLKKENVSNKDLETFDKFVNMYIYNLHTQNKDLEITLPNGKKISGTKSVQLLMKWTGLNSMAFKAILASGNAIGLFTSSYMMASEGIIYNSKQLNKAMKMILGDKAYKNKNTVSRAITKYFEVSARDLTFEKANNLSASKLVKNVTMDQAYIMYKHPDEFIENSVLVAMMQNYGISEDGSVKRLTRLPEGTKSLFDNAELKNDKLFIPGITDNKDNFVSFRKYIRKQTTKIKGSIPEDDKNLMGTNILFQALMQFRNWIPGTAKARWGKITYDSDMEELDVGRFRVIMGEFTESVGFKGKLKTLGNLVAESILSMPVVSKFKKKSIYDSKQNEKAAEFFYKKYQAEHPEDSKNVSFEDYKELRASKLKGMSKEISLYLTFMSLVSLLKSLIPDEEEEMISKYLAEKSYMATNKGLMELQFWFSPSSVQDILGSPVPAFRTIANIGKAISNTVDVGRDILIDDSENSLLQKKGGSAVFSKTKADRSPLFYYSHGLIPGVPAIEGFLNWFDKPIDFTR